MKAVLVLFSVILLSFTAMCQSTHDIEEVKSVVIAFQNDFNEGSFKMLLVMRL